MEQRRKPTVQWLQGHRIPAKSVAALYSQYLQGGAGYITRCLPFSALIMSVSHDF